MAARKKSLPVGIHTRRKLPQAGILTRQQVMDILWPPRTNVRGGRFTQDTPVTPDVWYAFAEAPDEVQELLLAPNRRLSVEQLALAVRLSLIDEGVTEPKVIYNQSHVLAKVTFRQLLRAIVPLSEWWIREIGEDATPIFATVEQLREEPELAELLLNPAALQGKKTGSTYNEDLLHVIRIVGALTLGKPIPAKTMIAAYCRNIVDALSTIYDPDFPAKLKKRFAALGEQRLIAHSAAGLARGPLWKVFTNRKAEGAVYYGRPVIKADAAHRLFQISCSGLRWAVVDSGIDATHAAFGAGLGEEKNPALSRIGRTYDFTRLKPLLYGDTTAEDLETIAKQSGIEDLTDAIAELRDRLAHGRLFDWERLERLLRVQHVKGDYPVPENQHGTHVAGILAADWHKSSEACKDMETVATDESIDIIGICPDIQLYDLRVFDASGDGDEFAILAALQFIRYLNANKDTVVVHGVNMSFSLKHSVDSYACGATPVCEECSRLTASGVVVVAAAGNRGFDKNSDDGFGIYRDISITDPGNSEDVITVGSTHRQLPHRYGVSYFSSRGPTGDGRVKPDLVAPGEKIVSTIPGDKQASLDGTSMAAPYVSGAAALLMARHKELVGQPRQVKEILCRTATDLGRERNFQGSGLVDVLRALQSV